MCLVVCAEFPHPPGPCRRWLGSVTFVGCSGWQLQIDGLGVNWTCENGNLDSGFGIDNSGIEVSICDSLSEGGLK